MRQISLPFSLSNAATKLVKKGESHPLGIVIDPNMPEVFARRFPDRTIVLRPHPSEDHEDWVEGPWLWSEEALEQDPWAHVHAFDVELGAYLLVINGKAGFSPGEALDFLLGLFTIDIAQDDWRPAEEDAQ